jgi:transcriptional antiterminator NusG
MSAQGIDFGYRRKPAGSALDTWFALRTRSRHEKILAGELTRKGIATFLPLTVCERIYANQPATVETPVFPGFVFLCGSAAEVSVAQETGRVTQVVRLEDVEVFDAELDQINTALLAGAKLGAHPYPRGGVRAKAIAGPMKGVEGIVEDLRGATILVLGIRELHLAASVAVEAGCLQVEEHFVRGMEIAGSDFPPPLRAIIAPPHGAV